MSLLPKTGVCFSCGYDHGQMGGLPPSVERSMESHAFELSIRDSRITELERQLGEVRVKHEVACSTLDIVKEQRTIAQKALAEQCNETKRLRSALVEARHALQFANDNPNGGINDTIWMMHRPETLFDFMDSVLDAHATAAPHQQSGEKEG